MAPKSSTKRKAPNFLRQEKMLLVELMLEFDPKKILTSTTRTTTIAEKKNRIWKEIVTRFNNSMVRKESVDKDTLMTLFRRIRNSSQNAEDAKVLQKYKKAVSKTGGGKAPPEPPIHDPDSDVSEEDTMSVSRELFSQVTRVVTPLKVEVTAVGNISEFIALATDTPSRSEQEEDEEEHKEELQEEEEPTATGPRSTVKFLSPFSMSFSICVVSQKLMIIFRHALPRDYVVANYFSHLD